MAKLKAIWNAVKAFFVKLWNKLFKKTQEAVNETVQEVKTETTVPPVETK